MISFTNGQLNLPASFIVLILVLPSIVSIVTIVTSYLNNRYQTNQQIKLEKFNIVYMQKLKIIQDFASSYGNLSKETYGNFVACTYTAMIIADEETQNILGSLLTSFLDGSEAKTSTSFERCTKCVKALTRTINE